MRRAVGAYELVALLGRGGQGEVWKAREAALGRLVALKILRTTGADELARFRREAQTAAGLIHPHIAAIYGIVESEGTHAIAMQLVEGETLRLWRGGRRQAVGLIRDAALALAFAHARGFVHRDVKPENLMVAGQHVFVMDFGLARAVEGGSVLSVSGETVGTPAYMAPEQARGEVVDERADVYSLGATLYDLLTGRPPFAGENVYDLLRLAQERDPVAPRSIDASIDADLETVVLKCLEKSRDERYVSATELAADLDRWLRGEAVAARATSGLRRLARRIARNKPIAVVGGLLLLAVAIGCALVVRQWKTSSGAIGAERERGARHEAARQRLAAVFATILERKRDLRQLKAPPTRALADLDAAVRSVALDDWPGEPQGLYVRGRGKYYLGDLDGAEADVLEAVTRRPEFRPGWALLGVIRIERYAELSQGLPDFAAARLPRIAPIMAAATEAFAKGWVAGQEAEESARWGLTWSREDQVMERLSRAYRAWFVDGKIEEAVRLASEGLEEYRAEEYLFVLAACSEGGRKLLDEILAMAPGYPVALHSRAIVRGTAGDLKGAIEDVDRALALWEPSATAHVRRSGFRARLGDNVGALADLNRAIELNPEFAEAYNNRAKLQPDEKAALADYEKSIALAPTACVPLCNRGLTKRELGDAAGAIADLKACLRIDGRYAPAWSGLGIQYSDEQKYAEAVTCFDKAIEIDPSVREAYTNRAAMKLALEDLHGALADAEVGVKVDPASSAARFTRGLAKWRLGDAAGALPDFDRAIAIDSTHVEAHFNRASALLALHRPLEAIPGFDRTIELKPSYPDAWNNRGVAKERTGDEEGALRDYTRGEELRAPQSRSNRAALRAKLGDFEGAVADYDVVIERAPKNAKALMNRGLARLSLQQYQGALDDYTAALTIQPSYAEAWFNRGALLEAFKDYKGAIADLEESLKVAPKDWAYRATAEQIIRQCKERR